MKNFFLLVFLYLILLSALVFAASAQTLTLEESVSLTLANNPRVKAITLETAKSKQQSTIARALYLPSVSLAASANHYFQRPVFFGFGEQSNQDQISYGRFGGEDQLAGGIVFEQALWNPQAFPIIRQATLREKEADLLLQEEQVKIVAQVKQTYLQLLILTERIKLKQQNLDRNRKVLQDSRILLAQGKALRIDTLRAYTSMKNLEPEHLKLQNELATARLRLAALIGIDSLRDISPADSLIIPVPKNLPDESEVYLITLASNPAVRRLALQESIHEQSSRQIQAQRLPVLALTGQYFVQSQTNNFDYGNMPLPATSYLGIRIALPLFNGLSVHARGQQSMLQERQSSLLLKNAEENLRSDVHQLVSAYNETLSRITIAKTVSETAKLTFDIVQYRYKNGVSSRLELTDSELALTQAQSNYLEAIYDYLTTRIRLFELMGKTD
ncbi:MAG TPA: TolC family protein [Chryseosolibacter sp.]